MTLLILGLIVFLAAHSVRIYAEPWRGAVPGAGVWAACQSLPRRLRSPLLGRPARGDSHERPGRLAQVPSSEESGAPERADGLPRSAHS